ncbi:hypothetical protein GPL17_18695 [Bradyrhizobium yuanmingense]|uniref:hypothetical protein n=1 Tax=Bradyrhizobium yuanmingense TaxID=108015 RepID=UPI0012FA4B1A|nr:hypothetical protein [Bradyrhizobium yuanmingense]MVT52513.1 hypothetical protein [Bradyrhizobium yuanmingense]
MDKINARAPQHSIEYMTPTQANACMVALEEGKSQRTITGIRGAIVSFKKLQKHITRYPLWGAKALELIEANRKLADKRKGRSNPNLAVRRENLPEEPIATFPDLKARNFSIPDGVQTCTNCPHPADCAAVGECLDTINARAVHPHCVEYMTPIQATQCMSALEEGMSKRALTGYVNGTKAIVSGGKFEKHCLRYPVWGAWALALVERNRKMADKKKGRRGHEFCKHGHAFALHGKSYLQRDGRWHRQCLACSSFRHTNPTHTPKPDLVEKVRAAAIAGTRVSALTNRHSATFICDFRQIRAIRRLHGDIAEMIDRNSQQRRLVLPRPAIIRLTNLREPTLTGVIAAPSDPLFTLADQTISRSMPPHIRRDAVVMLATALWLGELKPEDVEQAAKSFVRAAWKEDSVDMRFVSLDAPAFRDGKVPLVERLSVGLWP